MLIFKTLRYKNFLSSGAQFTEIQLNKTKSTLVVGSNGAGKSTMLDALTFGLFNKPFRKISKSQLVNTSNEKECVVEIEFSIGENDWKIVRGIKPAIFEIYKGKTLLDQASSSTDQQKWLEQNVLKLNYKSFTQIVVLGSSNFVPFMQLSSQHRREVVEDLLDIKVFSSMNDVAKIKIKELKDDIKEINYKKENFEDKIESQKMFIEEIEKRKGKDVQNKRLKIKTLDENVDSLNQENLSLESKVETCNTSLKELTFSEDKLKKLEKLNIKIEQKISSIIEEHKFFKGNNICPTCTQEINEDFRLNKIEEIQTKAKEIKGGQKELEQSIEQEKKIQKQFINLSNDVLELNNGITLNNVKISQLRKQIKEIESEIQDLTSKSQDRDTENTKLESLNQSLENVLKTLSNKKEELSNYEFIHMLLKDDGAKTKIIQKYLPVINHNLNKYLDMLDFCVNFTLDEEFNEKALNPIYEDFSYSSFSEGEKMRIDLAILFTWREVAKIKNSINTNLLILDEVFDSSLDDYGTDYFTKIVKYVIEKSNVFVISHKKDELLDKFDATISFEKRKGFSVMIDSNSL
jgi:DNA repair exonuclease SbcCD ATPase subunit